MDSYIQNLISRMADDSYRVREEKIEGSHESEKTILWAAHEDARLLNNSAFFPELVNIIDNTESIDIKNHAYFLLGHNTKNSKDLNATKFLLEKVSLEKEKTTLIIILDRLAELYKPIELDISCLYKFTTNRNWRVRASAFEALTNNRRGVENFFIEKLLTTLNKDDISPLLTSLKYVGTAKAIPHVEKHLKSRQPSIKGHSMNVLTVIMLREKFPFEQIQKMLKVSKDFVQVHFDRLDLHTRPG
jgi:hypothetical protein